GRPDAHGGDITAALEAVLFVAAVPLPEERLSEILGVQPPLLAAALEQLQRRLDTTRALELRRVAGGWRLVTRPEHAGVVARLGPIRRVTLSGPALEVLAVIAYRQPVTRAEIEAIRGVNSERSVRTLQEYGLIAEVGRKEAPGRPILYGTTDRFLELFGLGDLSDLPPLVPAAPGEGEGGDNVAAADGR
ncbi:MAG TPA: SMC-Scp complex subunit ScpB, partial [Bacillota bacterium]